jgi:hypothetical protein
VKIPVDVDVVNSGPHHLVVEHEWLDADDVRVFAPEDTRIRLQVTITFLDRCPGREPDVG